MRLLLQMTLGMLVVLVAAWGGGTSSAPPATEAPEAAPAPGAQGAILGDLLKDWQEQKDSMMKLADAMPEGKFGYKSTPAQRSYGEHVMHAALVNVDLLKLVGRQAAAPSFTAESAKTRVAAAFRRYEQTAFSIERGSRSPPMSASTIRRT